MNVVLCQRGEMAPFDVETLTEEAAQGVVQSIRSFFIGFLDQRSYTFFTPISARAENILKYHRARTIGDVKHLLMQSQSSQGVPRIGRMVQEELEGLVREASRA